MSFYFIANLLHIVMLHYSMWRERYAGVYTFTLIVHFSQTLVRMCMCVCLSCVVTRMYVFLHARFSPACACASVCVCVINTGHYGNKAFRRKKKTQTRHNFLNKKKNSNGWHHSANTHPLGLTHTPPLNAYSRLIQTMTSKRNPKK